MSDAHLRRAGVVLLSIAAVVLLAVALVVGGCGERKDTGKVVSPTPTSDKFVGTWKADLTVEKSGKSYTIDAGDEGVAQGTTGFSGCTIEKSGGEYEIAGITDEPLVFMTYDESATLTLPRFFEVKSGVATADGDALILKDGGSAVRIEVNGDTMTLTTKGHSFTATRQ